MRNDRLDAGRQNYFGEPPGMKPGEFVLKQPAGNRVGNSSQLTQVRITESNIKWEGEECGSCQLKGEGGRSDLPCSSPKE